MQEKVVVGTKYLLSLDSFVAPSTPQATMQATIISASCRARAEISKHLALPFSSFLFGVTSIARHLRQVYICMANDGELDSPRMQPEFHACLSLRN